MYQDNGQFGSAVYHAPERVSAALEYYGSCYHRMLDILPRTENHRLLEIGSGLAWMSRAGKLHGANLLTVAQDITDECVAECFWVDRYIVGFH
jgi:hypothetical protein